MKKYKVLFLFLFITLITAGMYYFFEITNSSVPDIPEISLDASGGNNIGSNALKVESPISIDYLRKANFDGSDITIESELSPGTNYKRYIASYLSSDVCSSDTFPEDCPKFKIYGLLTIPNSTMPEGGFPAIVFNHGYIPPAQYKTTEKYVAYVDSLARNGFVVFKIDLRGHGNSEGVPTGSYFSYGYTADAINAVKSLQNLSEVNPNRIGMWGHSMSGNLVLRAMLVNNSDIRAGVIWAGAVYSYEDFAKYGISDSSFDRSQYARVDQTEDYRRTREDSTNIQSLRENKSQDFKDDFWRSISLTSNIGYLDYPIQIHHAINDDVVNIAYSRDLSAVLAENGKDYEFYEYSGGGHNITSPYFETAMQRTIDFFKEKL